MKLQSLFLITDDIMDKSTTRRGQRCWYTLEDVGMIAINDSLMIENSIYYILKKTFEKDDYYIPLVELFHEAMMITTIGQSLDIQVFFLQCKSDFYFIFYFFSQPEKL